MSEKHSINTTIKGRNVRISLESDLMTFIKNQQVNHGINRSELLRRALRWYQECGGVAGEMQREKDKRAAQTWGGSV